MSWYLKKADGNVFGPVDDDACAQWAREGRIVPGDQLSEDQLTWLEPASLAQLGLDWFIPMEDGSPYGPLHALALSELIADGELGLDDTIAHRETREVHRVAEVLLPALQRYAASLRETLAEEQARAERAQQERDLRDDELLRLQKKVIELEAAAKQQEHTLHQRVRELESLVHQQPSAADAHAVQQARAELKEAKESAALHEKEAVRLKLLLDEESTKSAARDAETRAQIKKLQESELGLLKTIESTRGKADRAERQTGGTAGTSDYASLVSAYDDLTRNYDLLMDQFAAKTGDLNAAHAMLATIKKETEERCARIEETMRRERDDADKARARLAKAEEAHLELVRSYRELNDRHIRLRQKAESSGQPADTNAGDKPKVRLI